MNDGARPGRIPAISSYLQERLQQERQVDGDRNASTANGGRNTRTVGFRDDDTNSSLLWRRTFMGRRPQSAIGDEADIQSGFRVKEMEKVQTLDSLYQLVAIGGVYDTNQTSIQTLSTLHKQNLDLKVELHHRRERQTALEQRNATLERAQFELEKYDIALKEAINLIVGFENRVAELLREREMVRQIEADGTCRHSRDDKSDLEKPTVSTPHIQRFTGTLTVSNDKVVGRMSSVMSEHSEHMGNGRNDIHGDKNSPLHLRTVSQPSADPSEVSRVPSSSLNVLSESSVNVYGSNDKFTANPQSHSMGFYNDTFDELPIMDKKLRQDSWECQRGGDASPMRNGTSESSDSFSPQLQSLGTGVDMSPTPQQVGRLEPRLASSHIRRIPSITSRDSTNSNQIVAPARHSQPAAEIKTEQEKEVLQEELTLTPTNTDLAASRALPPIPDTVPTNTLCRSHNSNDALSCNTPQASIFDEQSKTSLSQYSIASSLDVRGNAICQPASNTASTSRREAHSQQSSTNLPNQCQYGHPLPPRSHPICESTSSRARANSWASDLEALDGGAGTYPEDEDSSFDYWIREASQGDEGDFCPPPQSHNMRIFSPGGWKARAIFGPLEKSGPVGSPALALSGASLDVPPVSITHCREGTFHPPAPYEPEDGITSLNPRSSLYGRTGSMSTSTRAISAVPRSLKENPVRTNSFRKIVGRLRSNSIGSVPAPRQQPQQQVHSGAMLTLKRNYYPPISGWMTRSRGLYGLSGLLRRAAVDDNNAQLQYHQVEQPRQAKSPGRMSVPPPLALSSSFSPAEMYEDELSSATPPPILRKRAPQGRHQPRQIH
ncbi:hypothetical protein PG995_009107 [Apiospora arundinis]